MPLTPGSRLGPYEILSLLGAGGMGEVYKARDTRLERTVAVKVLPPKLSSSPEGRQRFEREAKTISQFSHPHICALHDIGREGETEYLVMEYLEGETLSDRLAKGPLALDQTLRYGGEIADALDKAHRQGIVHRDLKPGNVMLTKSGVKLLDFGLAKAVAPLSAPNSQTAFPTEQNLTQEGTILGTFQYMAPEQLEGKEADARTDIFALGAVLYEMATGKKAFPAGSQASLITAIMSSDPAPISAVQPTSPAALDRVVRTCLAKDPEDRWQSAHDIGSELKWIREGSGAAAAVSGPRRVKRERLAWAIAALAVLAAAGVVYGSRRPAPAPQPVVLTLSPPPGLRFEAGGELSPDGRAVAFLASGKGPVAIWVRRLDELQARRLQGTESARYLFWSADGRSIAFFQGTKLRRIDAEGGTIQTICEAGSGFGGSWSADGTILFAPAFGTGLMAVPAAGGTPATATTLDASRGDASHLFPAFFPGGRRFVFVARNVDPEKTALVAGDLDSKGTRLLCRSDSAAAWSPTGHLLFAREGTLFAQAFDPVRLELQGEVVAVVRDVRYTTDNNSGSWSAAGGTLVYRLWPHDRSLVWVDRTGAVLGTLGAEADYDDVAISPDGRRVAASIRDTAHGQNLDVWVLDERGAASRITSARSDEFHPVWLPDGETLVYASDRAGPYDLYRRPAAGGSETVVLQTKWDKIGTGASPDGNSLTFIGSPSQSNEDVWIMPLVGATQARVAVETDRFTETGARFSPDGASFAFMSTESGMPEVYVSPVSVRSKRLVSSGGAHSPVWRRDGKELFYIAADGRLVAVPIAASPAGPVPGTPQPLFDLKAANASAFSPEIYDAAPNGQRFLVVREKSEETPGLVVRLHWEALLKTERP